MRTTLTLLLGACASMANAQLVNGSFEDGLNGWYLLPVEFNTLPLDVIDYPAPGQGDRSLVVPAVFEMAGAENKALQHLPQFTTDDVLHFGGWIRNVYLSDQSGTIQLCYCDSSTIYSSFGPIVGSNSMDWSYFEATGNVPPEPVPGPSVCICLSGGTHTGGEAIGGPWFDGLFVGSDQSTSAQITYPSTAPPHRPNPATDKLWVDLPEVPVSVIAIDASSRSHAIQNFQHISRTLELDVSALPSGVNVLRITTRSGSHTVRFIKA